MPIYTVTLGYVLNDQYEVEADDASDAEDKAVEMLQEAYPMMAETDAGIVVDLVSRADGEEEDTD